ncbi:MAG: hypothetical protein IT462_04270 [Planctomycetes bacterium]|nr:hypothetical protein [Planctomycetota bacterium]
MDIAIIIGLVIVAVAICATPFLRKRRIWFVGDVESELAIVTRQREEALRALKDLEEERLARKLSEADFTKLRPEYLARAKELTVKLDAVQAKLADARRRLEADLAK